MFVGKTYRKRIISCMDRLRKIHFIERMATRRIHMDEETNNLKTRPCMARYVEIYVRCNKEESKTKMGHRETKARQCQTIEGNILH